MLGPQDVGFRVVVRYVVGTRDDRPLFTDVLGELREFGPASLAVESRKGLVSIPRKAVVAGKRIPPRRDRVPPPEPE
jgi:N-acetylglutamate synthase